MTQKIRFLVGSVSEYNHLEVAGSIPTEGKNNKEYLMIHIYPTPPLGQDMTQGQFS